MFNVIFFTIIFTSILVLHDARAIGVRKGQIQGLGDMGPWGWFFTCLFFWIVGFPFYLFKRREYMRINGISFLDENPWWVEPLFGTRKIETEATILKIIGFIWCAILSLLMLIYLNGVFQSKGFSYELFDARIWIGFLILITPGIIALIFAGKIQKIIKYRNLYAGEGEKNDG